MGRVTVRRPVTRITLGEGTSRRSDSLTAEEPLEIRLDGTPLAVTMRTPGNDIELAHGFLATEGIIAGPDDVLTARYCAGAVEELDELLVDGAAGDGLRVLDQPTTRNTYNVLELKLAPHVPPPAVDPTRNFYTTSSCGVCGKASIDAITQQLRWDVASDPVRLDPAIIAELPDRLREHQRTFSRTGGLHAAGLFSAAGELLHSAEDVGRHNAVDKVIGWALLNGRLPATGSVLVVSGRASFELTQKALMAGIPALAAVSAPSSLAVECAEEAGMTLFGFVRPPRLNVYTRADRVVTASD
ncbi:formate dehydrogenase accessory sulfurtransferase FdhD [Enemella evansiae]|uniref:formate dehydrogenase accessory sulfurtransferase FdhD n=1 Tax=Enemella evansiae TaxID=2016499 RepID=UPI000B96CF7A|nr:formate dehydrogenase accessory sulfurtransferase FdhD [Enemella evansiae]OYN98489.1 sulfurtransferase FdhD [Enemella evansiae]OYN99856.1 sulfurtransferase FdhD [Enemella evansiae]